MTPLYLQELELPCLLTNHRTQRLLLKQQSCHNPHLESYLGEVVRPLRQYKRDALANPSGMDTPRDLKIAAIAW